MACEAGRIPAEWTELALYKPCCGRAVVSCLMGAVGVLRGEAARQASSARCSCGSEEGGGCGEHGGTAPRAHHAVNERTCRRATVVYGRLIKQKQYSSDPPEPSPGARKCSLSTMWLWPPTKDR